MNEAIPATERTTSTRSMPRRGYRFALLGLVFGFLGLGTAAYRMSLESEQPTRPKAKEVSEALSDAIKKTADKLRHKPPNPPPAPAVVEWPVSRQLGLAASICGFVGAVFGCISWLVGEHRRWTWAALCVGVVALAWTHVVVAVALAVAIVIAIWLIGILA